jgi:hypothetical protein
MGRRKIYKAPPSLNVEAPQPSAYEPDTEWRRPLTRDCLRCGREFVIEPPPGAKATAANATYCPECREPHKKERRHGYYVDVELPNIDKVYELHNAARAERCPPKELACCICGKKFTRRRSEVTCDDPECRKQNKINVRAEYDVREHDAVCEKRREKWAANSDEINAARRAKRRITKL